MDKIKELILGDGFFKQQRLLIIFLLLNFNLAYSQLNDFTLIVNKTDETCNGNATLTFNVEGTTPDSQILYTVYKLPDEFNPIYSGFDNFVGGRDAGDYKIVALQTLGTESNTQEAYVTIDDLTDPLTYTADVYTQNCQDGGQVIITTQTGIAVQYEIISPITVPLQDSNIFTGLPPGTYDFRVIDECGNGIVRTFTISYDSQDPVVSQPIYDEILSGDCNSVTITNTITYPETSAISYPLTIQYTIHPADGSPDIVTTQTFDSGAPSYLEFSDVFPVVDGQPYTYDILITNSCGNTYGNQGMVVNPQPALSLSAIPLPCGEYYLGVTVSNFSQSYTLDFTSAPEDFDPVTFNPIALNEISDPHIFFGSTDLPVPVGTYDITITDECGRTATSSIEIVDDLLPPSVQVSNNGCNDSDLGRIVISFPDRAVAIALITQAPAGYPVPEDVSSSINSNGKLVLANMPVGEYYIDITDECGRLYEHVEAIVPEFQERNFRADQGAGCEAGFGSAKVQSLNSFLVSMTITEAPAAFGQTLPYDVTDLIVNGQVYIGNLPVGDYTFEGVDNCGYEKEVSLTITDDSVPVTDSTVDFQPHCSSFDIGLFDTPSSFATATYWLQKEDEDSPGTWGHPDTGAVYVEGTIPDASNSLQLQNNTININFFYTGQFRVIRAYTSFGNGMQSNNCITVLEEFEYYDQADIQNVYLISCDIDSGLLPDIYIEAVGPEPLHYYITQKNDDTGFYIDNGTNNIFSGLEPATYKFKVTDGCGGFRSRTVDISLLPNLAIANQPDDRLICIEPGASQQQEFDLTQFNSEILGPQQSPDIYTVTYYASQDDADNLTNPLPYTYTNQSNPQTIYAAVEHNLIHLCHGTTSFTIQFSDNPQIIPSQELTLCSNIGYVRLTATAGYDEYLWSNGETTQDITVTEAGDYTVTVRKYYGDEYCEASSMFTVLPSDAPDITDIEIVDWTDNDNSITVVAEGNSVFEYSLDNTNWQDNPQFSGLEPGIYTVYVRDVTGCGVTDQEVALLNYPKFFTPNGDGHHEYWRIKNSWLEPGMMLFIYDRYGKLLSSFTSQEQGWDGTLNGKPLPSTDYWFVVNRRDGRIFKGHFSLIR